MKKYKVALILSAVLMTLTACTAPSVGHTSDPSDTSASSDALRTYYEALIADLKQEILDLKQSDYVARLEYESRITELESKLNAVETPPSNTDISVSAPDDPFFPSESTPQESTPSDESTASFHYIIQDGAAVICAYLGQAKNVTVPREIAGFPVRSIADDAFRGSSISTVILPDTVQGIGWFAFADCTFLTSVTLPASVASIGYGAFDGCPNLTVYCPKDSYAAAYALSFSLRVRYL